MRIRNVAVLFQLLLSYTIFDISTSYKPVLIIHGLLDGAPQLGDLKSLILKAHPGTQVEVIDAFSNYNSFTPLWQQVYVIRNLTRDFFSNATEGAHVIGYSQGGLVGRGLISVMDNHNVHSFIALSSPLNGQYGDTSVVNKFLPSWMRKEAYEFFYTKRGQKWSIGNYWKDPHHLDYYAKYSQYLAVLNNESASNEQYPLGNWKSNFLKLQNLVLVGGPDDDVITPWQSAHFGSYDANENIIPMRNQSIYKDDVFGLKSLDKQGRLHECTVPGVMHKFWHGNATVFHKCIEHFLT